ncbi:MAG: hypothetical protein AAF360_00215, partial [Pseudomonadota bacterium]
LVSLSAGAADLAGGGPPGAAPTSFQRISSTGVSETAASAPVRLSARVSLGGEARGGGEAEWPAEVARISDTVSPETRSIGVIVRVADPYAAPSGRRRPPLIKGMFVKVELTAPPVAGAILLPRAAIRDDQVLLIDDDDRLAYAPASPVFAAGGLVVLAPGALPDGARVVTSQPSPAIEGHLLSPVADTEAEARIRIAGEERAR